MTDVDPGRSGLDLGDGWTKRWTVSWRTDGDGTSSSVQELVQEPVLSSDPMRHFTWRPGQRHRPGLQFLTSTGRHHGAESLEEGRVLLALDFAGDLVDVVSQPLKISFDAGGKRRHHTPDYLAVTRHGVWLIDVRPKALIKEPDRESFAAAAEVAVACGWRYTVAARWREHAFARLGRAGFAAPAAVSQLEHLIATWSVAVWQRRTLHPPIARTAALLKAGRPTRQIDGLFASTARYCPDCLAGDGTPIQKRHGGPWQRVRRLLMFFVCLRHERFLEHLCPACHQAIGSRRYGHLIARPTIAGLHPAQCRQPRPRAEGRPLSREDLCQGRLDRAELHPADRPSTELLALQQKIAALLAAGAPEPASQYFTELQLVTALVIITWPRSRPGTSSTAVTAADQYAAEHHVPKQRHHSNAPRTDARACGAFLQAADTILSADDLRIALMPLAPVENRTRTGITPTRHHSWDTAFKKNGSTDARHSTHATGDPPAASVGRPGPQPLCEICRLVCGPGYRRP
ncbi:TniQ family protein [Streptomyces sp. MMS24-I31]|uniref:TniQ family protein n=1 Tax=Streptomyces sp. MMS24-I31 TaxID=3351563 RepID=UPI003896CB68